MSRRVGELGTIIGRCWPHETPSGRAGTDQSATHDGGGGISVVNGWRRGLEVWLFPVER